MDCSFFLGGSSGSQDKHIEAWRSGIAFYKETHPKGLKYTYRENNNNRTQCCRAKFYGGTFAFEKPFRYVCLKTRKHIFEKLTSYIQLSTSTRVWSLALFDYRYLEVWSKCMYISSFVAFYFFRICSFPDITCSADKMRVLYKNLEFAFLFYPTKIITSFQKRPISTTL